MPVEHTLPPDLLRHQAVRILVAGAGGTGSAIVMGLPYLDQAMRVRGRCHGLDVVMEDADTVSETNCVQQPFSTSDIGQTASICSGARTGRQSPITFMRAPSTATRTAVQTW